MTLNQLWKRPGSQLVPAWQLGPEVSESYWRSVLFTILPRLTPVPSRIRPTVAASGRVTIYSGRCRHLIRAWTPLPRFTATAIRLGLRTETFSSPFLDAIVTASRRKATYPYFCLIPLQQAPAVGMSRPPSINRACEECKRQVTF